MLIGVVSGNKIRTTAHITHENLEKLANKPKPNKSKQPLLGPALCIIFILLFGLLIVVEGTCTEHKMVESTITEC